MEPILTLSLIILVFSLVQSVLGVGLLVFGTPTLLLLGYEFKEVLSIVLPSSVAISALQLITCPQISRGFGRGFLIYSLPPLIMGLGIVLLGGFHFAFREIVGWMLLATVTVRTFPRAYEGLSRVIKRFGSAYLFALGFIHGLSSMGGGLLTLYSTNISKAKTEIRSNIAFGYLIWGIIQYSLLIFSNVELLRVRSLLFVFLSVGIYLALGNRVFRFTSERLYGHIITLLLFFYGSVLIFL